MATLSSQAIECLKISSVFGVTIAVAGATLHVGENFITNAMTKKKTKLSAVLPAIARTAAAGMIGAILIFLVTSLTGGTLEVYLVDTNGDQSWFGGRNKNSMAAACPLKIKSPEKVNGGSNASVCDSYTR